MRITINNGLVDEKFTIGQGRDFVVRVMRRPKRGSPKPQPFVHVVHIDKNDKHHTIETFVDEEKNCPAIIAHCIGRLFSELK